MSGRVRSILVKTQTFNFDSFVTWLKTLMFGTPFPTSRESHERLDKVRALAVFASDPISSNAYATEAIMSVVILLGSGALSLTLPIAFGVATLVLMVAFSYYQTILHYPSGGGAYIVARDNLGDKAGLIAAAALLVDYVLTVSVSVSAGIRAITSAIPEVHDYRVYLAVGAVLLLTWLNLRGVRESGTLFAIPTYAFVISVVVVILIGLARFFELGGLPQLEPHPEFVAESVELATFGFVWLLLRAFSGGCTALTGIEAISNGVQAFKKPEAKNAATTMIFMAVIAMTLFMGISFLATRLQLVPHEQKSILSQLTSLVAGNGIIFYIVQTTTMLILILAANTGYQDFPRLCSFLAHDGFLPRWMANRGDRLVYSSGIITLAAISAGLIILFQAEEIAMLPLYAIGVFVAFTLSQSGMVKLMSKIGTLSKGESMKTQATTIHFESGWQWKRAVNIFGAIVTSIVLVVLIATKLLEGAWIVIATITILVIHFSAIHRHYQDLAATLRTNGKKETCKKVANVAIVLVSDLHRGSLLAIQYGKLIADDVRAVCISTSQDMEERIHTKWIRYDSELVGVQLVTRYNDFRDIITPLVSYIEEVQQEFPDQLTSVVIPEFIPARWWHRFLHNRHGDLVRYRLSQAENVVLIEIPFKVRKNAGYVH